MAQEQMPDGTSTERRRNRTYDEIKVGDEASSSRVLTARDLLVFAHASGNFNPIHLPRERDRDHKKHNPVGPAMWAGSLISAVLGNSLPGPGTLYLSQSLMFRERIMIGDAVTTSVKVREKKEDRVVVFDTRVVRADGAPVVEGVAEVRAPAESIEIAPEVVPSLLIERHQHIERLIDLCANLPPMPTAVVCPEDENALGGMVLAAEAGLIEPILIGDPARMQAVAKAEGHDLSKFEIIETPDDAAASREAVALARDGRVVAIMKGHLHTDTLLHAVVSREGGIRTNRRLSHVFAMDVPSMDHVLLVTDAAINIAPTLEDKVDIVQNAIDLAQALGLSQPKVGILSAVEIVNPKIPSTLDAAVLCKMAERGQIKGGILDGPLAMDNALSLAAAKTKGLTSLVAGQANVLVVPNLESGNMLAKELAYVAHAEGAGLVLGAAVPIMLTSRADDERSRLASCAVAALYAEWKRTGHPVAGAPMEAE